MAQVVGWTAGWAGNGLDAAPPRPPGGPPTARRVAAVLTGLLAAVILYQTALQPGAAITRAIFDWNAAARLISMIVTYGALVFVGR